MYLKANFTLNEKQFSFYPFKYINPYTDIHKYTNHKFIVLFMRH